MIEFDIELPAEWTKRTEDNQHRIPVAEYQYTTAEDTTFIVSILPQADAKRYTLRLSTITLTAKANDQATIVDAIREEFEAAVAEDVPCGSI
jgi:hypothetical protein